METAANKLMKRVKLVVSAAYSNPSISRVKSVRLFIDIVKLEERKQLYIQLHPDNWDSQGDKKVVPLSECTT